MRLTNSLAWRRILVIDGRDGDGRTVLFPIADKITVAIIQPWHLAEAKVH